jgi:hypothetical protein
VPSIAEIAAKSAGATAGLGVGGGLSYEFFDKAHGGDLLMLGNVYGLTAFAFIALILLVSGYISLPTDVGQQARRIIFISVGLFGLLAIGGFIYQVVNPSVTIKAAFYQDLEHINTEFGIPQRNALQASIKDENGQTYYFIHGKDVPVTVHAGRELTIDLEHLPDVLRDAIEIKVADSSCSGGCNQIAAEEDDHDAAH